MQRTRRSKPPVGGLRSSHAGEKTFKVRRQTKIGYLVIYILCYSLYSICCM